MQRAFIQSSDRRRSLLGALAMVCLSLATARAQLAITEVMSSAATNDGPTLVQRGSDFWELTNFGTNSVDLTNYAFTDFSGGDGNTNLLDGLILGPGESAIFIRTNYGPSNRIASEAQFREWWGTGLRPEVKVRGFSTPGFDNVEDCVRLFDPQGQEVDRVCFGKARNGVSFTYDTNGDFGVYSVTGACGAFQAVTADDIGSPGMTCGPVPLKLLAQPNNLSNLCYGLDAFFCVQASGLPRPKYQWVFNGSPIAGATEACLTITNAQASSAGEYHVIVTNGLNAITSAPAFLTVDTNPTPPKPLISNLVVERFEDERAAFTVQVCAYPIPVFQWYSNGVVIPEAADRTLLLSTVSLPMSGTVFSTSISNVLGSTNVFWRLLVYPQPQLEITEVMPAPDTNWTSGGHANWFELTNRGTNAVKLNMLKHSDRNSPDGRKPVTQGDVLLPGKSAIFVENISREQFFKWWGADNLPPDLIVVTYNGYGLNAWSDSVYVWSIAAESEFGAFASVTWASGTPPPMESTCPIGSDPEFIGHPMNGHALYFEQSDPNAWSGIVSRTNHHGNFHSDQGDDEGSPGFGTKRAVFLALRKLDTLAELKIHILPQKTYQLEVKTNFASAAWSDSVGMSSTNATVFLTNFHAPGSTEGYYRLRELP